MKPILISEEGERLPANQPLQSQLMSERGGEGHTRDSGRWPCGSQVASRAGHGRGLYRQSPGRGRIRKPRPPGSFLWSPMDRCSSAGAPASPGRKTCPRSSPTMANGTSVFVGCDVVRLLQRTEHSRPTSRVVGSAGPVARTASSSVSSLESGLRQSCSVHYCRRAGWQTYLTAPLLRAHSQRSGDRIALPQPQVVPP